MWRLILIISVAIYLIVVLPFGIDGSEEEDDGGTGVMVTRFWPNLGIPVSSSESPECPLKGYKGKCRSNADCCSNYCRRKRCRKPKPFVESSNASVNKCLPEGATNCTPPLTSGNSKCCMGACKLAEGSYHCPVSAAAAAAAQRT